MSEDLGYLLWHSDSTVITDNFCSLLCMGLLTVDT